MHGIDVETAGNNGGGALTPEEGQLRLVQLSDGKQTDIYDAFLDDADVIRKAIEAREELVAHNAVFEQTWLKHALGIDRPDLHDNDEAVSFPRRHGSSRGSGRDRERTGVFC